MWLNRRAVLAGGMAMLMSRARAMPSGGIAVIDWALLETMLAMGIMPQAASELRQYRKIVQQPAVPETVTDIGLRGTPSFEMLRLVAPDFILISQFYEYQRPSLERIGRVHSLPTYRAAEPPYALLEETTRRLGLLLSADEAAGRLINGTSAELDVARQRLAPIKGRPIFAISLGDARHFRAFGRDSIFGEVLERLGLLNAWTDPTSYSAAAPVGLEALARTPDAGIVVLGPLPPEVGLGLPRNAIWNALPSVKAGRVAVLPAINHFGGLPSARRFARLLAEQVSAWPSA